MAEDPTKRLTGRDRDILELAANGLTDKQIADQLGLSRGTVIGYWSRIRLKLQVSSRTEAVSIIKSLALKASEETGQALQHELQEKSEEAVVLRNQSLELEKKVRERTAALHEANKVLEEEVLRRTQSEEALKQSEFKFRSLYENAEVALFTSNVDGSALSEANLLALSLFQGTRSQLIGKPTINYWADPEQRSVVVQRLMAEGKIAGVECDFLGRKGSVKHCSVNAVLDRETSLIEWSAIDITDKARAKRIIDKNLDRTRLLLNLHERSPKLNDQDLYHLILDIAVELTDSSVGFFHLVSGDQENIQLTAWNKETLKACTALYDTHYSISQAGNWVDCIRAMRPVVYNDYKNSPNQKGLPEGHFPISRFMSVPVISEGKVRIIFGVGSKQLPYDENDVRQIELLAIDVQPILENRQLHQDLVKSESEVRRKLDALVNPDENISDLDLLDMLDVREFDRLFKQFRQMTGIAGGFIGVDGQGYAGSNWQEVCSKFHRANGRSCERCIESDRLLTSDIKPGCYKLYKCLNNLWEMATPIYYGERKLGFIVFGQFFFEDERPDMETYARQAESLGFDKKDYLESLAKVPIFSREYIHNALTLFSSVCNVLLGLNFSKLKIARHLHERVEMFELARMGEERYRSVVESVSDWIFGTNAEGVITFASTKVELALGYVPEFLIEKPLSFFVSSQSTKQTKEAINKIWSARSPIVEQPVSLMHRDGTTREYICNGKPIHDASGGFAGYIGSMRDVTERKKAEEALKRSEEKFRTAFQTSPDAVNINRLSDGLYLESNDGFADILGYTPEEVLGKTSLELNIWDDPADRKRLVEGLRCDGQVNNLDARFRHKDGTIRYGLMSARIIDLEGEACILSITRDITKRKEVEKKLAQHQAELKAVYDNAPVMICVLDEERRVLYANPAFTSYTGVSEEELRSGRACGVFGCINASDDPRGCGFGMDCATCSLLQALKETLGAGVVRRDVERTLIIERDGSRQEVTLLGSTAPIQFGEHKNILLCLVDITARKQAEKKLGMSEELLRTVLDNSRDGINMLDLRTGKYVFMNSAQVALTGFTFDEINGISAEEAINRVHPEDRHISEDHQRLVMAGEDILEPVEYRWKVKSGEYRWFSDVRTVILDENGTPIQVVGVSRDITDRVQAENKLRKSESQFRNAFEHSAIGVALISPKGKWLKANQKVSDLLGYSESELKKLTFQDVTHPDDLDAGLNLVSQVLHGEIDSFEMEKRYYHRDGHVVWAFLAVSLVRDQQGNPLHFIAQIEDITERKMAEDEAREIRARLESAMDMAQMAKWEYSVESGLFTFNDRFYALYGTTAECEGGYQMPAEAYAREFVHPDDAFHVGSELNKVASTHDPDFKREIEHRIVRRDGETRNIVVRYGVKLDDSGNVVMTYGANQDITERKRAEEKLRESEELYQHIDSSSRDAIYSYDRQGRFIHANRSLCELLGLKQEQIVGKTHAELGFPKAQCDEWDALHRKVYETNQSVISETMTPIQGGPPTYFEVVLNPIHDESGDIIGISGTTRNITERKQTQAQLRLQSLVLDQIQDRVTVTDIDGVITYVNDAEIRSIGYSREELIGASTKVYGEDPERGATQREILEKTLELGEWRGEVVNVSAEGNETIVDCRTQAVRDEHGVVVALAGFATDITKRKRAEETIKTSEANFRTFFGSVMDMVAVCTPDGQVLHANDAMIEKLGYSLEELTSMGVLDLHPADRRPEAEEIFSAMIRGECDTCPLPLQRKDGALIPVETRASFGKWNGKDCVFGISKDLTAEQEAQQRFERLFRSNPALMAVTDISERRFIDVNDTWLETMGFEREEVIGRTANELGLFANIEQLKPILEQLETEGRFNNAELTVRDKRGSILQGLFAGEIIVSQDKKYLLTVMVNETERIQAENALRASEIKLRETARIAKCGGWEIDLAGNTLAWTDETFRIHELDTYREPSVAGAIGFYHPDDQPKVIAAVQKAIETGIGFDFEARLITAKKNVIWVRAIGTAVYSEGQPTGIRGMIQDITDIKRAEEALRKSEETYRALIEGLPDIVMRFDRDGRHVFVSDNVDLIVDIKPACFIGKTHAEMGFPKDLCSFWEESIRQVFDSGAAFETEFAFEGKAGPVILDWRLIPERDAQGTVASVLSISRDVTAYRKVEQEYETLFREMMDGCALHEIIVDGEGKPTDYRFLAVNPAFERLTGLKGEHVIGRTVLEVLPDTEKHWIERYGRVALTGIPDHFQSYTETLGRHYEVAAFRPAPMQFACLFADITDRVHATAQLLAAQQELEDKVATRTAQLAEANAELEAFSYSISHDLRAPLRTLGGFTQILKEDYRSSLDYEGVHLVDRIGASAEHMGNLIDGLLRLSRINQSKLDIKKVCLSDICNRFIESIEDSEGGTDIEWMIEPGVYALCDIQLVESLVDNLLSNAVKYSSKTVSPKIRFGTKQIDSETVMFISDNGVGFDMSNNDRLFKAFQRLHNAEDYEGLGIGLATAKRIVSRHGGRIWAESKPGEGSTFLFTLPNGS